MTDYSEGDFEPILQLIPSVDIPIGFNKDVYITYHNPAVGRPFRMLNQLFEFALSQGYNELTHSGNITTRWGNNTNILTTVNNTLTTTLVPGDLVTNYDLALFLVNDGGGPSWKRANVGGL